MSQGANAAHWLRRWQGIDEFSGSMGMPVADLNGATDQSSISNYWKNLRCPRELDWAVSALYETAGETISTLCSWTVSH
jgi:hypothetical protein